ncbi:MAG: O-antigen ligase family protein [Bacteroidales bacterium]|nr:O-antigen ligase family protein [Bacteroidales bacterium]
MLLFAEHILIVESSPEFAGKWRVVTPIVVKDYKQLKEKQLTDRVKMKYGFGNKDAVMGTVRMIYIICLSGIAFSLPLSEFLTSVFTIFLLVNHVIMAVARPGVIVRRFQNPMLILLGGYLVYILWVLNSSDTVSALHSLRLRLPLVVIPFVVFTAPAITIKELRVMLFSFIVGVTISSFAGVFLFYRNDALLLNTRELSPFISHIRMSLMICLALVVLTDALAERIITHPAIKAGVFVLSGWLVTYMVFMSSLTGLALLMILMVSAIIIYVIRSGKLFLRIGALAVTILIVTLPAVYVSGIVLDYLTMKEQALPDYSARTPSGRDYTHHTGLYGRENGYYTWNYICEEELAEGWNRVSTIPYNGYDSLGHELRFTLIRYLTSMGLRKDSAGVESLSQEDIRLIEQGYANRNYLDGSGLHDRIYEIVWQIDHYVSGGNPQGHSVTQRLCFFRNGWRVFIRSPLFGTGTGDYNNEVARQYVADQTILDPEFRRLPHNQYLTSLGTFGLMGATLFWLFMLLPAAVSGSFRKRLFFFFFLIIFLSMLTEDTLETHTGVTFFALFYSLFMSPYGKGDGTPFTRGKGIISG